MEKNPCKCCCNGPCPCPLIGATKPEPEKVEFPPKPIFRFVRILEYVGDKKWIQSCIINRGVKGKLNVGRGNIKELSALFAEEVTNGK